MVPGGGGVGVWPAVAPWILEQTIRDSWGTWRLFLVYRYHYDHSVHPGWLGAVRRRISRNDGKNRVPHEGPGVIGGIILFVEAGCAPSGLFARCISGPAKHGNR